MIMPWQMLGFIISFQYFTLVIELSTMPCTLFRLQVSPQSSSIGVIQRLFKWQTSMHVRQARQIKMLFITDTRQAANETFEDAFKDLICKNNVSVCMHVSVLYLFATVYELALHLQFFFFIGAIQIHLHLQ